MYLFFGKYVESYFLFKFLKLLIKFTQFVLGLGCAKYESFHSELFVLSRTPSRNASFSSS